MPTTSRDGTTIAYEITGTGAPLVLVAGALQGGATYRPLADALADRFRVITYDRRGRGDSGDTAPYAVEREIEDLAAVIEVVGGAASVCGHSSGAGLALHAAEYGLPIDRLVLHELPFDPDENEEEAREQHIAFRDLLRQDRRGDALETFFSSVGMPPDVVAHLREDPAMLANAPTLLYDPFAVMSSESRGGRTPFRQAEEVTVPTLVLGGTEGPPWMLTTARRLAEALPRGRLRILEGQGHVVPPEVLAPVLTEFLAT